MFPDKEVPFKESLMDTITDFDNNAGFAISPAYSASRFPVLAMLLCLVMLAGCGGGDPEEIDDASAAAGGKGAPTINAGGHARIAGPGCGIPSEAVASILGAK